MRELRIYFFTDEFSLKACPLESYLTLFYSVIQMDAHGVADNMQCQWITFIVFRLSLYSQ